jgi:hypothetical protein
MPRIAHHHLMQGNIGRPELGVVVVTPLAHLRRHLMGSRHVLVRHIGLIEPRGGHRPLQGQPARLSRARTPLPSTVPLAERYDASLSVVKMTVDILRNEGLVIGQQGKGVFLGDLCPRRSNSEPGGRVDASLDSYLLLCCTKDVG